MLPACKYGPNCYRKNADHLQKFSHERAVADAAIKDEAESEVKEPEPKKVKIQDDNNDDDKKKAAESDSGSSSDEEDTAKQVILVPIITSDAECEKFCRSSFLCSMPQDFYHFCNFIKDLKGKMKNDTPLKVLKTDLVGPFHVISNKLEGKQLTKSDLLCYFRYPTDPPELQTVMITPKYRFGYWRDNFHCSTEAIVVQVENDVKHFPKFKIVGDNLFAAFKTVIDNYNGDDDDKEYSMIDELFVVHCTKQKYSMEAFSDKVKQRKKNVVAPSLHGVGIVVPVQNDVGYRPLGENNVWFKKTLTTIGTTEDDGIRESLMEKLQETFTYVQFANDEMDYGMGLEFAHDLWVSGYPDFATLIKNLLPTAYFLLNAPELEAITRAHLKQRFDQKHLKTLT